MNCSECGSAIPSVKQAWQKVEGWERQRDAGGTNAIALRKVHQLFMCDSCMRRLKRGIPTGQQTLM